jgi:peptidoglycan-associated lipoprotein
MKYAIMEPLKSRVQFIGTSTVAIALLATACAANKPTAATASSVPLNQIPTGSTEAMPANTPTDSNVTISQDILSACKMSAAAAHFVFESASITPSDRSPLDAVAACFTSGPLAGKPLVLVGHADPRGTAEYNTTLGQSRADSVAEYLTAHGVTRAQEQTSSRGALDATGMSEDGWARDRRVDLSLGF